MPRGNHDGGSLSWGNNMEARLAELQDTLARLVAASAQPTPGATGSGAFTSRSAPRLSHLLFEYGAAGQVISAVATRSQAGAPQVSTVAIDPLGRVTQGARHKGPGDGIGQLRLPMTFGLADVAANLPQGTPGGNDTEESVLKSLALKVLQVPLFSGAQLQYPEFDPAAVYLMVGKIMQGKAVVPAHASTEAMQAEKGDSSSWLWMRMAQGFKPPRQQRKPCAYGKGGRRILLFHRQCIMIVLHFPVITLFAPLVRVMWPLSIWLGFQLDLHESAIR